MGFFAIHADGELAAVHGRAADQDGAALDVQLEVHHQHSRVFLELLELSAESTPCLPQNKLVRHEAHAHDFRRHVAADAGDHIWMLAADHNREWKDYPAQVPRRRNLDDRQRGSTQNRTSRVRSMRIDASSRVEPALEDQPAEREVARSGADRSASRRRSPNAHEQVCAQGSTDQADPTAGSKSMKARSRFAEVLPRRPKSRAGAKSVRWSEPTVDPAGEIICTCDACAIAKQDEENHDRRFEGQTCRPRRRRERVRTGVGKGAARESQETRRDSAAGSTSSESGKKTRVESA